MRKWLGFGVVLLVTLLARAYGAASESVWYDEAATLPFINASSLSEYLDAGRSTDVYKVPLYFVVQYAWWHAVSPTVIGLRLLSILVALLTAAVLYLCCQRFWGTWVALTAGSYFALSKYFVFYGQEIRMYGLMYLFALASWFALHAAVRGNRRAWPLHAALNLLLVQTHLFGLVSVAAQGVFLVLESPRNWRRSIAWTAVHLCIALTLVPWIPYFAGHERLMNWIPVPTAATLLKTYLLVNSGATWTDDYPLPVAPKWIAFAIAVVALPASAIGMRKLQRDGGRPAALLLLCWMLTPPLLLFAASVAVRPAYVNRYALYAAFPFFILVGKGIASMQTYRRVVIASALAVLCTLNVYSFQRPVRPDLAAAADVVRFNRQPGDRVSPRGMGYVLCMRVYLPGIEDDLIPTDVPVRRVARDAARGPRVWFVLDTLDKDYPRWGAAIDDVIAKGGIHIQMEDSTGPPRPVRVILLAPDDER